jgi:uncharacterized DUF497 family protein
MHPEDVIRVAGFDWDEANRSKCERHGVAVATIEALFQRPLAVMPDPAIRMPKRDSKRSDKAKPVATC